jgi:hypothetical protein
MERFRMPVGRVVAAVIALMTGSSGSIGTIAYYCGICANTMHRFVGVFAQMAEGYNHDRAERHAASWNYVEADESVFASNDGVPVWVAGAIELDPTTKKVTSMRLQVLDGTRTRECTCAIAEKMVAPFAILVADGLSVYDRIGAKRCVHVERVNHHYFQFVNCRGFGTNDTVRTRRHTGIRMQQKHRGAARERGAGATNARPDGVQLRRGPVHLGYRHGRSGYSANAIR